MKILLLYILLPIRGITQDHTLFPKVPYDNNTIIYEKIYNLDSINNKDKIFNGVKAALIQNTNYKYSKINEDRNAGNITAEINFSFSAKPGIMRIVFHATSQLSFDIKENRYRVRLYNNTAKMTAMNVTFDYDMVETYLAEKKNFEKGKWKKAKSIIVSWNSDLVLILNAFETLVSKGLNDDEF